jgi:hypothetical protein
MEPTQPRVQWVSGPISPGIKRRGREADTVTSIQSQGQELCSYTPTPPHVLMAWYLIKHMDNFTWR